MELIFLSHHHISPRLSSPTEPTTKTRRKKNKRKKERKEDDERGHGRDRHFSSSSLSLAKVEGYEGKRTERDG